MTYKLSILLSIFRRNGGEGLFTQIVNENNLYQYKKLFSGYIENEIPIIVQYTNEDYWFIFSNLRLILAESENVTDIWFETIKKVSAPVFQEALFGAKSLSGFSLIELETSEEQKYILKTEGGLPYTGMFHMLQFITNVSIQTKQDSK